jgi:hypothetical protein
MNLKMDFSTSTAVLLFAQSGAVASTLKPIACCAKKNVLLWTKMNDHTIKVIQKSKLPYFIIDENDQIGVTFGERLTHSIQSIFDKGFEKVIVIGNDCIELKAHHLLRAKQDLKGNDLVIGSNYSGGAYLIGVAKSKFKPALFRSIPWQTKSVFTALQMLYKHESIAYLSFLNDCNNTFDFKRATQRLSFSDTLKKILLSFFSNFHVQNELEERFDSAHYQTFNFNKGSPCSA